MKLSISLPDSMAQEIKKTAQKSERQVSWIIQKAWQIARHKISQGQLTEKKPRISLKKFKLAGRFDDVDVRKLAYE